MELPSVTGGVGEASAQRLTGDAPLVSTVSVNQLFSRVAEKSAESLPLSFSLCSSCVSAPVFDYEDVPSPLSESESTITVLLRPALARGAPVRYGAFHFPLTAAVAPPEHCCTASNG